MTIHSVPEMASKQSKSQYRCSIFYLLFLLLLLVVVVMRGRRVRNRIAVGFKTTYAIIVNCVFESRSGETCSIQHYVIKLVRNLWHVGGFLQVIRFEI